MKKYKYSNITEQIIKAAFAVHNELGFGFLEKVYKMALVIELNNMGLDTKIEQPIEVRYKGTTVGNYFADLIVEDKIIIELKAVNELTKAHEVQLVNYLRATGIENGLLINFSESVEVKRKILDKINL